MSGIIKIDNLNKWFGEFQVLKDIDLEVQQNKKLSYVDHLVQVSQH